MFTPLYIGNKGPQVVLLQQYLSTALNKEIKPDGNFGPKTASAVWEFQQKNNINATGVVDTCTWSKLTQEDGNDTTTDLSETYKVSTPLKIEKFPLDVDEYFKGPTNKNYIFLHHTAGWDNPYETVKSWNTDNRGRIGTQFVIGGKNIKTGDSTYDGTTLETFSDSAHASHLGKTGSSTMHKTSIGIELCNFGWIDSRTGKTYVGTTPLTTEIITLNTPFRGFKTWHRYTDTQLDALRQLLIEVGNRNNIDIRTGLPKLIRDKGPAAFEFNYDAYYGKVYGIWSHSNVRKDKFDVSPQPNLLDMLISL